MTTKFDAEETRARLVLRWRFYGELLSFLDIVENPQITTARTDGYKIEVNREWLERLTRAQQLTIIAHELHHVVLRHIDRRRGRAPLRWNVATDMVINAALRRDGLALPESLVLPPKGAEYENAETLYEALGKGAEKAYVALDDPSMWDEKSDGGDSDAASRDSDADSRAKEFDKLSDEWRKRVIQAATRAQLQGHLPDSWKALVERLIQPDADWWTHVEQFVHHTRTPQDYRWYPPSRRGMASGLYLPSAFSERVEFVLAVDSSGSVSDIEIQYTLSRVEGILRRCNDYIVHVIVCDAAVQDYRVLRPGQGELPREFPRGGTDFRPVFEFIRERGIRPTGLLYVTDGEGSFPTQAPSYPVLWLLYTGMTPPFGKAVRVKQRGY